MSEGPQCVRGRGEGWTDLEFGLFVELPALIDSPVEMNSYGDERFHH